MKFKEIIIVFFVFGVTTMLGTNNVSAGTMSMQQFDKSTMIKKKLSDAQNYIAKGNYVAAQNALNSLLKLDPNNSRAKVLLDSCEYGIKKQKQQIYQAYIEACNTGTINSLKNFISKYPNSEYAFQAKKRVEDYSMWKKAKEQNTISAYNSYLSSSTIRAYKDDANKAIKNIQAEIEWSNCKNSNDEDKLNAFIKKFPSSSFVDQAKYKLNILKGERYYTDNNYILAYSYLNDANNFQTLSGLPAQHYKTIIDKREFDDVISSSDVEKVKRYLHTISYSNPYYDLTSNRLAVLLATSFSTYSSEYEMNEAMSYAKDNDTKILLKSYINKIKSEKAYYEHQRKIAARKAWWKNRFMVGWNVFNLDYLDGIMGVGTGLKFRFGRWNDPVNLLFGAEYSYLMYLVTDYRDDSSVSTVTHTVEAPVGLRLNLCKASTYSKLYIGCNASFGFNFAENECFFARGEYWGVSKQTLSIEPQVGFASKNLDFGIYYKKYLKDQGLFKYTNNYDQRIGCFFTWFL